MGVTVVVVAASFTFRLAAWARWQKRASESEGVEVSRIAENLRNAVGYVGLETPGARLKFQSSLSADDSWASLVTYDYELAGRRAALLIGAVLPLPVFGIASVCSTNVWDSLRRL